MPQMLRAATAALALTSASLLVQQSCAFAHLGGTVDSVTADKTTLNGQMHSTATTLYDVHEIDVGSATVVREYVTRSGTVFAVTWHGPTPPNLQQLFGNYFSRFRDAAAATAQDHPSSHRQFSMNQSDFVVQSAGHMRSFVGRAYLPAQLPTGVSLSDIQ